ncbi:hypothetical protein G5714_021077 [Onychostoma macrolepis]|uniref:Uncharacterized protein n=1 Tax=Onychostoma macrolepis TaxID=369639 RepID=A0A7J6BVN4_9TELE|nr:hypothetical protein G5714_021077 [Onychostoma macrolepis]
MDSIGNNIEPKKLFPRQRVLALHCRNTKRVHELLTSDDLGSPQCIIIHTGTNDLHSLNEGTAKAMHERAEKASQTFPRSRVLVSSLLPWLDVPPSVIDKISEEVRHSCSSLPNVHLVNHSSIRPWHLFDGLHLNQDGVRIFAKAIKDVALGRFPTTGYKGAKRNVRMQPFEPSGPSSRSRPPQDLHRQPMTSGWSHRQQEKQPYTEGPSQQRPSYAQITATPSAAAAQELSITDLEQDFFLFKEETNNNLHQLLNLTSVQQLQQLCSAVRHLEEDNQELRQELRRVREELTRREQHGHTLERRLEETRTQLHTIQQQRCVSTRPHSSPTTTTQQQRCVSSQTPSTSTNSAQQQRVSTQSRSSFTPATRQSPQAHQNLSSTQIHPPTTTSSSFTSNGREQERKDNIVILCDSNGHHLDPRRLFPGRSVKKFCPQKTHPDREERAGQLPGSYAAVAARRGILGKRILPESLLSRPVERLSRGGLRVRHSRHLRRHGNTTTTTTRCRFPREILRNVFVEYAVVMATVAVPAGNLLPAVSHLRERRHGDAPMFGRKQA